MLRGAALLVAAGCFVAARACGTTSPTPEGLSESARLIPLTLAAIFSGWPLPYRVVVAQTGAGQLLMGVPAEKAWLQLGVPPAVGPWGPTGFGAPSVTDLGVDGHVIAISRSSSGHLEILEHVVTHTGLRSSLAWGAPPPGVAPDGDVAGTLDPSDRRLLVATVATDGRLWRRTRDLAGSMSPWESTQVAVRTDSELQFTHEGGVRLWSVGPDNLVIFPRGPSASWRATLLPLPSTLGRPTGELEIATHSGRAIAVLRLSDGRLAKADLALDGSAGSSWDLLDITAHPERNSFALTTEVDPPALWVRGTASELWRCSGPQLSTRSQVPFKGTSSGIRSGFALSGLPAGGLTFVGTVGPEARYVFTARPDGAIECSGAPVSSRTLTTGAFGEPCMDEWNGHVVLAGGVGDYQVMCSTDDGNTWQVGGSPVGGRSSAFFGITDLDVSFDGDGRLWAVAMDNNTDGSLMHSDDGGMTWASDLFLGHADRPYIEASKTDGGVYVFWSGADHTPPRFRYCKADCTNPNQWSTTLRYPAPPEHHPHASFSLGPQDSRGFLFFAVRNDESCPAGPESCIGVRALPVSALPDVAAGGSEPGAQAAFEAAIRGLVPAILAGYRGARPEDDLPDCRFDVNISAAPDEPRVLVTAIARRQPSDRWDTLVASSVPGTTDPPQFSPWRSVGAHLFDQDHDYVDGTPVALAGGYGLVSWNLRPAGACTRPGGVPQVLMMRAGGSVWNRPWTLPPYELGAMPNHIQLLSAGGYYHTHAFTMQGSGSAAGVATGFMSWDTFGK